ncbi:MAG TPA: STM4012 family radical SAM protein [Ktedonobacteraceae bacterium]|nr:STM4012 family radical SAM protein [Ktedonobacteraceae bacterium]
MIALEKMLQETPYVSYTYAYPHKTAYRSFPSPLRLDELWAQERRSSIFLYMHVPFCEMRCGFCNLFTTVDTSAKFAAGYLAALGRQAERVRAALGEVSIARMAIGGGTPTHLATDDLARLFDLAERLFNVVPGSVPTSVETSPLTATPAKLQLLRTRGVDRISIGVQSFIEAESRAAGRTQQTAVVEQALAAIRAEHFPTLNIDLIYGLPGQTVASWLASLQAALRYQPEELYLYPLYIRPLTGLGRKGAIDDTDSEDMRLTCYRQGRDLLLAAGYTQVSMRMFRAAHAPVETGPIYCVQDDGMVGLGCGARSYTRTHHYASEYAVGAQGVRAILAEYMAMPAEAFDFAYYGFCLNGEEQRRRYALKSLLEAGGLNLASYRLRFESDVFSDLPELRALLDSEMATLTEHVMILTAAGIERSDTIGPWLYSTRVKELMRGYQLR